MVFGSLLADLLIVALCGLLGGFFLSLLQERGVEIPHLRKEKDEKDRDKRPWIFYWDAGFIAEALIGALAAVILYTLNPPSGQLTLIASGLTSGLGGAGILKGFVEKGNSQKLAGLATEATSIAKSLTGGANTPAIGGASTPENAGPNAPAVSPALVERLDDIGNQITTFM